MSSTSLNDKERSILGRLPKDGMWARTLELWDRVEPIASLHLGLAELEKKGYVEKKDTPRPPASGPGPDISWRKRMASSTGLSFEEQGEIAAATLNLNLESLIHSRAIVAYIKGNAKGPEEFQRAADQEATKLANALFKLMDKEK